MASSAGSTSRVSERPPKSGSLPPGGDQDQAPARHRQERADLVMPGRVVQDHDGATPAQVGPPQCGALADGFRYLRGNSEFLRLPWRPAKCASRKTSLLSDECWRSEPMARCGQRGFQRTVRYLSAGSRIAEYHTAFAILPSCDTLARPAVSLTFTPEHSLIAKDYGIAAESNETFLKDSLRDTNHAIRVMELTSPDAAPYQDGTTLFTPLRSSTQPGSY